MAAKMISDTNTRKAERLVMAAARNRLGRGLVSVWEHGHWWVERKATGEQWSVSDCNNNDGFDFEKVTEGEQ